MCSCTNPINVQDDEENHYLMSKGELNNQDCHLYQRTRR